MNTMLCIKSLLQKLLINLSLYQLNMNLKQKQRLKLQEIIFTAKTECTIGKKQVHSLLNCYTRNSDEYSFSIVFQLQMEIVWLRFWIRVVLWYTQSWSQRFSINQLLILQICGARIVSKDEVENFYVAVVQLPFHWCDDSRDSN